MIYKNKEFPKVLLLGNGLLRAYGKTVSWDNLLKDLHRNKSIDVNYDFSSVSFPLEIVLRTDDNVDQVLRELKNKNNYLDNRSVTPELREILERLLNCKFNHILTTNYGYEIETVAAKKDNISNYFLEKSKQHTNKVKKSEGGLSLGSYYQIDENKIWHIHGEAKNISSIVLGHYYYGRLLSKYHNYFLKLGSTYKFRQDNNISQKIVSWLDAFILGDVYILGLGMDFSEMDLWWLINRKKRENATTGSIYFFEPSTGDAVNLKHELLKSYGVEIVDLGYKLLNSENKSEEEKQIINAENAIIYRDFYNKAIGELENGIIFDVELE